MTERKNKAYYLSLPYLWNFEPHQDADGDCYFVAYLRDIPQVRADGATKEEARRNLALAFEDYLDWRLEQGLPIPLPSVGVPSAPPEVRLVEVQPSPSCSAAEERTSRIIRRDPTAGNEAVQQENQSRTTSSTDEIFYEPEPIVVGGMR